MYLYLNCIRNSMYRTREKIDKSIKILLEDLNNIALEDEIISDDEKAILDKINYELHNLQTQIMQILESDLDDDEFHDILKDTLHDIIVNVKIVADADGKITEDENKLLKRLQEFISGGIYNE